MRAPTLEEVRAFKAQLSEEDLRYIDASMTWAPLPGPQQLAWDSPADELFFGGQAGGGKTDFLCGLALERHQVSIIYRREAPQLSGITDRLSHLLGGRDQFAAGDRVWRLGTRQVEYGSMPNIGDEQRYQGRPHDLLVFDEITQFTELQYRYLLTWNRHADHVPPSQRCRVVVTGNPPTTPEGLWVTQYWGPWLNPDHPLYDTVAPGELLYYVTVHGEDLVVPDGGPYLHPETGKWVRPRSRTFIPAAIDDNPFLLRTGYADTLEGLPEPLRSQMRYGDFTAGQEDHEWQVIPSAWVDAAMVRWKLRQHDNHGALSSLGVDPSRGGKDQFIIQPRHGSFFAEQHAYPGTAAPTGQAGAALCLQHLRNSAPVNIDVVGVGYSVIDHLEGLGVETNAIHGAAGCTRRSKNGSLKFANLRAYCYWHVRELLDPANPDPIALPPSVSLKADLCSPRYSVGPRGVQVESKEELLRPARLGRSPDEGDACVYAAYMYESAGNESQSDLGRQRDAHFDGPYKRDPSVAHIPETMKKSRWAGWNDPIVYPD